MDILSEVRSQYEDIPNMPEKERFKVVLEHLEMAITHYRYGLKNQDARYFNDTILRANHVFEGSLKEAYAIFTSKDVNKVSLHDIEKFLSKDPELGDRIKSLLTNYRQHWRNESTHSYFTTYKSSDALMAIMLTSAFLGILFEKMVVELARQHAEQTATQQIINPSKSLIDVLKDIFTDYLNTYFGLSFNKEVGPRYFSHVLEGEILAYINQSEWRIERNFSLPRGENLDAIIESDKEKALFDLKGIGTRGPNVIIDRFHYLRSIQLGYQIENGVLFVFDSNDMDGKHYALKKFEHYGTPNTKLLVIAPHSILQKLDRQN